MKARLGSAGRGLRLPVAALAAGIALLLLGQAAPAAPAVTAGASKAPTASVNIKNFAFHPHTLNVSKGTTVVFSNLSKVTHTATRGGVFDTGHIKPGHSVAVRFTQKGTFPYHCKIHPEMHGTIVVG